MAAAAPYADLSAMLVDGLLREGVLEHDKGDIVLHHCFATMRYEDTVVNKNLAELMHCLCRSVYMVADGRLVTYIDHRFWCATLSRNSARCSIPRPRWAPSAWWNATP
jgi:hypothetical protein